MKKQSLSGPSVLPRVLNSDPSPDAKPRNRGDRGPKVVLTNQVAPNSNHPLAGLTAENRTSERVRAIASVLARLLRDQVAGTAPINKEVG